MRCAGDVKGRVVIDACCGTGDLSLAFSRAGATVVGVDFTPEMLRIAAPAKPLSEGGYAQGDAMRLPLASRVADVVSVAFGLRNVADRVECMREMARVLRPGGLVLVLEFGMPRGAMMSAFYRFYFTRVLPFIGGLLSDRSAYRYLPDTVLEWPSAEELRSEMDAIGLTDCGFQRLTGGIAYLHSGRVPVDG